jgi:ElaB/YqjD/DUF883 family membrane-anchored ribosome-binding protein
MTKEKDAPESDAARSDPSVADENREELRKKAESQLGKTRDESKRSKNERR